MTDASLTRVSRRTTLQWLVAITAGSGIAYSVASRAGTSNHKLIKTAITKGYGTDPDLLNPSVPWPRTLGPMQLRVTAILADHFLPGTPLPSALGLQDFIDEWVSAPYPRQQADRKLILEGLEWFEAQSQRRWARTFLDAADTQCNELIESIVAMNSGEDRTPYTFFRRFRQVIAGAYYTTPEGAKDIGYIGNTPLPSYPAVTDSERSILDAELRKLGVG